MANRTCCDDNQKKERKDERREKEERSNEVARARIDAARGRPRKVFCFFKFRSARYELEYRRALGKYSSNCLDIVLMSFTSMTPFSSKSPLTTYFGWLDEPWNAAATLGTSFMSTLPSRASGSFNITDGTDTFEGRFTVKDTDYVHFEGKIVGHDTVEYEGLLLKLEMTGTDLYRDADPLTNGISAAFTAYVLFLT